jgi:hypothetical protein
MKMKKILSLVLISIISITSSFAKEIVLPVEVKQSTVEKGDSVILKVDFKVSDNWMVYDSIIGEGGPIPLTYDLSTLTNLTLLKVIKPEQLHKKHDDIFEVDMLYFQEDVTYQFVFVKTKKSEAYSFSGFLEYMCCNLTSGVCLAPRTFDVSSQK